MATIASLNVQLIAKSQQFTAGMQAASAKLTGFAGVAASMGSAVTKAFLGIPPLAEAFGGISMFSGVWESLRKTMEEIDSVAKVADRLGISTEHLTGFIHAAELSGVKTEALTSGLEVLARKLGQINQQGGAAGDAMRSLRIDLDGMAAVSGSISEEWAELGLNAKRLATLPLADALMEIAERMSKLKTAADKNALAFAVFGRRGQALMPFLMGGKKGIQDMIEEANRLGYSFSRIDAAKVEAANDAMTRISHVFEGIKRSVAIELSPIIAVVAENFTEWLTSIGGVKGAIKEIGQFSTTFLANVVAIAAKAVEVMEKAEGLIDRMEGTGSFAWATFNSATVGMADAIARLGAEPNAVQSSGRGVLSGRLNQLADDLRKVQERFSIFEGPGGTEHGGAGRVAEEMRKKIAALAESLDAAASAYGRNSQQVAINKLRLEGATAAQLAAVQARVAELETLDRLTSRATATLTIYDEWRSKADQLQAALRAGKISAEGFAGAMQKIGDALLNNEVVKAAEIFRETRNPLEAMQAKIAELNALLDRGAIDWELYKRSVYGAAKSLMDMHKAESLRMSGAIEFGSQEAYKIVNQNLLNSRGQKSGVELLREGMKAELEELKRIKKDMADLAAMGRRGFLAVGRI